MADAPEQVRKVSARDGAKQAGTLGPALCPPAVLFSEGAAPHELAKSADLGA